MIKDLVIGRGPAVPPISRTPKVKLSTLYVVARYGAHKILEDRWTPQYPFDFEFKPGAVVPAWEKGIVGMKPGGRRELIVPSAEAYGDGARIFVVKLLSLKKLDASAR